MFTGLVEGTGNVVRSGQGRLVIETSLDGLAIGDSLSVNGVCLTVRERGSGTLAFDLSEETRGRTSLGSLERGRVVNLERPVRADSMMGGHFVQGHADGVAKVAQVRTLPGSVEITFDVPPELLHYIVEKGSIAVDGVSLTVTKVKDREVSVSLIPHTLGATNLGSMTAGRLVNVEVDILAKYVERLIAHKEEA